MAATSAAKKSSPASMPIEDYDRLSIKDILPLLTGLNARELKAVAAHEKAGKNRVTLLRAVRKVELDREAAAPKRPAKATAKAKAPRLTVVEEDLAPVVAVAVAPAPVVRSTLDDLDFDFESDVEPVPQPKTTKAPAARKPRSRPAVKAATWEEEVRPQLPPRRFETSTLDELDPPIVALVPPSAPSPALAPVPRATRHPKSTTPKTARDAIAKVISDKPRVVKRFESVALVMAAILAILLGLAIGTVLARTGSSDAGPAPASASSQPAAVQTAG